MQTQITWPLVKNVIRKNKKSNTFGRFVEREKGAHWGWDFQANVGTPCFAIADGRIAAVYGAVSENKGFGLVVVLEFEFEGRTLYAAYCHLSAAVVSRELEVNRGQLLGYTGNSGNAFKMDKFNEHLHFEIRTIIKPGLGGPPHRIDPIMVFKTCPLLVPIFES